MITRTCEGSNQAQRMVMARQLQFPARIGLTCLTRDRMGVDVGGGSTPFPHRTACPCKPTYGCRRAGAGRARCGRCPPI
jgi:hypothetical protein